jgi:hypothetical protein
MIRKWHFYVISDDHYSSYHIDMNFDDVIEKVCRDKRTKNIPILFVTQILIVILDLFRLEEK